MTNPLLRDRAAVNNSQFTYTDYANIEAITATSNGLTTAIITANKKVVAVTSASELYYVDIPYTSNVGHVLRIMTNAIGAKLTSVQNTAACYVNGVNLRNKAATFELPPYSAIDFIKADATHWVAIPSAMEGETWQGIPVYEAVKVESVTATAGGATTGIITAGSRVVLATSTNNAHFITLPTPVIGKAITIIRNSANACIVQPETATHTINGVACGGLGATGVGLTMATLTVAELLCVSATAWIAIHKNNIVLPA